MEILSAVVRALKRGVRLIMLTHVVDDLASDQSSALETIRREAEQIEGRLIVYSTPVTEWAFSMPIVHGALRRHRG